MKTVVIMGLGGHHNVIKWFLISENDGYHNVIRWVLLNEDDGYHVIRWLSSCG